MRRHHSKSLLHGACSPRMRGPAAGLANPHVPTPRQQTVMDCSSCCRVAQPAQGRRGSSSSSSSRRGGRRRSGAVRPVSERGAPGLSAGQRLRPSGRQPSQQRVRLPTAPSWQSCWPRPHRRPAVHVPSWCVYRRAYKAVLTATAAAVAVAAAATASQRASCGKLCRLQQASWRGRPGRQPLTAQAAACRAAACQVTCLP